MPHLIILDDTKELSGACDKAVETATRAHVALHGEGITKQEIQRIELALTNVKVAVQAATATIATATAQLDDLFPPMP